MNTREVLQNLISRPYEPFTVMGLREEIGLHLLNIPESDPQKFVCEFLYGKLKTLLQAINIPLLNEISTAIKKKTLEKPAIDENIHISANPSPEEAAEFCTTIHQELQRTQSYKEELTHFVSFFVQAKGYVNSFATSAEIVLKDYFEGRKELRQQKDALLNDLEVYRVYLNNLAKELNHILEDILCPRMNLGCRMESSLRLLERYRDPQARGFTIQT